MIDYDFRTLNDKEFENLSIELISKNRERRFERFKAGKDGGIDGRYYHVDGTQEIIQCKHYLKTGFKGLITSLKKKNANGINEIEKVNKLNPSKYIFITSLSLSPEDKKTIKELFNPYIKCDNDIYGQEDLNDILGKNPDIEKRHYKLWLSSSVVLDKLLNNAIASRSEFLIENIKENSKHYVVTDNHNKALEKLEISHIIIIAGEPGIGKTTLAEHMSLLYIEQGFKFYNIENSINEAENIYKKDVKQIFYFDDFLGSNYLNAIEDKKDSHIIKFMERIKRDKTKRFILTSRTNIFNQSLALSDTFKSKNIENEEFIIKIDSLKNIDKAMILYNHIWHSFLDEEFIDEIYFEKRYKDIITHKNFSPRIIEFITDVSKIEKETIVSKDYWAYILEKLDNPQDIWKNTFEKQSDEFVRSLVLLTVFNGNKIEEVNLRNAYNEYNRLIQLQNYSHTSKDFDSIIEEVVKYFLNRTIKYDKSIEYSLFNPSIADFIINRYKNNVEQLKLVCLSLQTLLSLSNLKYLTKNNFLTQENYKDILDYLFEQCNIDVKQPIFFINIALTKIDEELIDSKAKFDQKIKYFLDDLDFSGNIHSIFGDLLELLVYATKEFNYKLDLYELIKDNITDDIVEIPNILQIYKNLQLDDKSIITYLEEGLEDTLIDILKDEAQDIDISDFIRHYSCYEYDYPPDIDVGGVESKIEDLLYDLIIDFDTDIIDINIGEILNSVNIDDLIERYFSKQGDYDDEGRHRGGGKSYSNDIDDLFER